MLITMRTTLILDDHLLRAAKLRAAANGLTLSRVVEDALRESLMTRRVAENQVGLLYEPLTYGRPGTSSAIEPDALHGLIDGDDLAPYRR